MTIAGIENSVGKTRPGWGPFSWDTLVLCPRAGVWCSRPLGCSAPLPQDTFSWVEGQAGGQQPRCPQALRGQTSQPVSGAGSGQDTAPSQWPIHPFGCGPRLLLSCTVYLIGQAGKLRPRPEPGSLFLGHGLFLRTRDTQSYRKKREQRRPSAPKASEADVWPSASQGHRQRVGDGTPEVQRLV